MKIRHLRTAAKKWAKFMDITVPFEVLLGNREDLPGWIPTPGPDSRACTMGSPENDHFIIVVFYDTPPELAEHILVHELVHVHIGSQVGGDPVEAMECAVELCAQLVEKLHVLEHPHGE